MEDNKALVRIPAPYKYLPFRRGLSQMIQDNKMLLASNFSSWFAFHDTGLGLVYVSLNLKQTFDTIHIKC